MGHSEVDVTHDASQPPRPRQAQKGPNKGRQVPSDRLLDRRQTHPETSTGGDALYTSYRLLGDAGTPRPNIRRDTGRRPLDDDEATEHSSN